MTPARKLVPFFIASENSPDSPLFFMVRLVRFFMPWVWLGLYQSPALGSLFL